MLNKTKHKPCAVGGDSSDTVAAILGSNDVSLKVAWGIVNISNDTTIKISRSVSLAGT